MDGTWGERKRGMDLADLDRRSQEQTSKREAGWEWLRSRVPTGIHSQL
jgi:hypothetical protein